MQISGVRYLELIRFHPKLKLLRSTDLQALKSSSDCKMAMLKARYQGEMILNKEAFMTNHRMLECPLAWSLESDIVKLTESLL